MSRCWAPMVLGAQGRSCGRGRDLESALPFLEKPLSMPGPQTPKTTFLKKPPFPGLPGPATYMSQEQTVTPFVGILLVASDRTPFKEA